MASIQKRGEYYHAFYRNHLGKRTCTSTKSSDPEVAQFTANLFEKASKMARDKSFTPEIAHRMLNELAAKIDRKRVTSNPDHQPETAP